MIKYFLLLLTAAVGFIGCQNNSPENSKEIQSLKQALIDNPASVSELTEEVSKEECELAFGIINEYLNSKLKEEFQAEWQNETLELGDKQLKFKFKKFGEKPAEGWSLYISMHGGGNAPAELNDQQWENQQKLYEPAEGIYMAARAPTNTWNLWHEAHIDTFFARFIQLADVFEDINTNRVYLTGYSAGGDGTYQLAPRMADQLAAAAMMAGHPNDASPLGLRNLPFSIYVGAEDAAYRRNEIAAEWGVKLDELQKEDPAGYIHDVHVPEGMGHWMERKDTLAIEWMAQFNRNVYPDKVVWKQSGVTRNRFYWLAVPEGTAVKDAEVIATREGQIIEIEKADLVTELIINLNDEMLDLDKKVSVRYNGKTIYNAVPKRSVSRIWKSLNERNDLQQVFCTKINVSLK